MIDAPTRPTAPVKARAPGLPAPEEIDLAMLADKQTDGYGRRNEAQALALQIKQHPEFWI